MSTTLSALSEGQQAIVSQINGGKSLAKKMLGLGIRQGAEVSLLHKRRKGFVLANKGTRIALSDSMANCLLVDLIPNA